MAVVALFVGVLAGSTSATKTDPKEDHKITICHVTNSATNPFVVVTIDVTAWDDGLGGFDGKFKHSADHHVNKKTLDVDEVYSGPSGTKDPIYCGDGPE